MATYDAPQSAGSTQPKGSLTNTDTSPFEAYDEKVAAADVREVSVGASRRRSDPLGG
jgi:hypothetical protein